MPGGLLGQIRLRSSLVDGSGTRTLFYTSVRGLFTEDFQCVWADSAEAIKSAYPELFIYPERPQRTFGPEYEAQRDRECLTNAVQLEDLPGTPIFRLIQNQRPPF